jgi:hypothetical protein
MPAVSSSERRGSAQEPAAKTTPDLLAIEQAILQTVAYADVFDYPLTLAEIQRYLAGVPASLETTRTIVYTGRLTRRALARGDDYFMLPGREALGEIRRSRTAAAAPLWTRARQYGRIIETLPFVRMVAVTGALAMDNVEPQADIDYFIVTEPGRLWLCRALVLVLVRLAARRGDVICPNYFLSERALVLSERSLFTAHELAQMVPIAGQSAYQRMRQLNAWTDGFLPNAQGTPRPMATSKTPGGPIRTLAEIGLRTPVGGWLEGWEMRRKVHKFSQQHPNHVEATFGADWCKGHFDGHGQRVLTAFADRLRTLDRLR